MEKKEARKIGLLEREKTPLEERLAYSKNIEEKIIEIIKNNGYKNIFVYLSCKAEVSTYLLIQNLKKMNCNISVPFIVGDKMEASKLDEKTNLVENVYHILEPKYLEEAKDIDLCICPVVAFTKTLDRVGMGKGYYDRFFEKYSPKMKIGIAFSNQEVDKITMDTFDIPLDRIITEKNILEKS